MLITCIAFWTLPYMVDVTLTELLFQTLSMLTTSGFHNEEACYWPSALHVFFVILSMIGGCTGSTSGGLKIFRFQIIYRTLCVRRCIK